MTTAQFKHVSYLWDKTRAAELAERRALAGAPRREGATGVVGTLVRIGR